MSMKTIEIEIAMMKYFDIRQNIIIPNVSWGMQLNGKILHECDVLSLSKNGYATEIEIKITKADLLKDKEKRHQHSHNHIKNFYFAVPEKLKDLALKEIPKHAGLFILFKFKDGFISTVMEKKAEVNKKAIKWTDEERLKLAHLGCMRILKLKEKVLYWKNKKQLSFEL